MAAPMLKCVCHILQTDNEPITAVSDTSWSKLCDCMAIWLTIDGIEKEVAVNFNRTDRQNAGYHRSCYQRFTNKKRIETGTRRRDKGCLRQPDEETGTAESVLSPKKSKLLLRSNTVGVNTVPRRSKHVLPEECIICKKTKTIVDKSTFKRKYEPLVTCETNAEKLLQAAKLKKDEKILVAIGNFDPVCIEVRYHGSCYKQYTKCAYDSKEALGRPLSKTFDTFCMEIINDRIVHGEEVLRMSYLTEQFISLALEVEQLDITGYRNDQLKSRLKKKYPNLRYVQPDKVTCEFVFYQNKGEDSIIQFDNFDDNCLETESNTDEGEEFSHFAKGEHTIHDQFAQLYRAAVIIRNAINDSASVSNWPPVAEDFSVVESMKMIPDVLFNFLIWCCGVSDEFSIECVHLQDSDTQRKIISLAQDLIYLSSQGRKLMPKHLALGITLRHLTGSAKLQQLLNNFGHCVSHSVTLEHDTALARKQLERDSDVPPGFRSDVFTTLVWDNNDFGEETLSGKGTTHNTNGIIIQDSSNEATTSLEKTTTMSRDKKRTIDPPSLDIGPFYGQKRKGPKQFQGKNPDLSRKVDVQEEPRLIDQALIHAKVCQDDALLPGWTTCNQILSNDTHNLSAIGYLPVIDASPTEKSTVNAILEKSLIISKQLNLPAIVLDMDQAIYAKAQEIRWYGRPEFRDQLVLRLGEFHTAMAFLGVIGKRFGDAGLRDVAIESNLIAEGSINGVINGHHYNRSLRCHKIISEAMYHLRVQEFLDQLPPDEQQDAFSIIQTIHDSFPSSFMSNLQTESVQDFLHQYVDYVQKRCRENYMYAFWTTYLELVELLLLFLRGTREGNWELHLSAIRDMIPWFFAYGRINYSRYLPIYYLEMKDLPSTHPFVHSHLSNGKFAVKRHDDHGFALTACDQIIEQTYNRDSKTRGGLTGITLNKGAVRRWILSYPARAAIASSCFNMASTTSNKQSSKPERIVSQAAVDEQAIQDVMLTIQEFSSPFSHEDDKELVNICSGKVAPEDVRTDLFSANTKGEECFKTFVNERLIEEQKDIFDKLSLPTGKTFSDIDKSLFQV